MTIRQRTTVRLARLDEGAWCVQIDFASGDSAWTLYDARHMWPEYRKSPPFVVRNLERLWVEANRRNKIQRIVEKFGGDSGMLTWGDK